ncbi:TPA: type 1 fimbrial protein [Serratia fonticola]|uniref:fimbrial protein n=1 Tax=Serratia fonticola TaxID=47917 RepID=UPI0013788818|nr:fimbrial protein [Serratia fonticola]MBC3218112.1 type 1 fimbrial protein [Serratia fonticola]NCG51183.1 type 1 fimbrial protein [Serratia fonticola]HEJ9059135.1 type 1 fimbrial protein [Serratia fonticola]
MNALIKNTLLIMVASSMSWAVQATNINIAGNVVASACNVDSGSVSQDVDFGQLRSTDLKEAGTATDWKPFTVKLTHCPLSTSKVTATFSGSPSTDGADLFANSGTAKNVAVQVVQDANKALVQGNGSRMTVNVDAQHEAIYALAGRIYSVNGDTVAGTLSCVLVMNFTYQ